jgi:hypothetical protein
MAERVTYLVDEVPPRVPVRQRIPTVSSASRDRGSSPFTRTTTERRRRGALFAELDQMDVGGLHDFLTRVRHLRTLRVVQYQCRQEQRGSEYT